jgi:hypothetical protein
MPEMYALGAVMSLKNDPGRQAPSDPSSGSADLIAPARTLVGDARETHRPYVADDARTNRERRQVPMDPKQQAGSKGRSLSVKRDELKDGDRLIEMSGGGAVLGRADGIWGCDCSEWTWDCDIGPNGAVWCTKVCVRYDCAPLPSAMGMMRG